MLGEPDQYKTSLTKAWDPQPMGEDDWPLGLGPQQYETGLGLDANMRRLAVKRQDLKILALKKEQHNLDMLNILEEHEHKQHNLDMMKVLGNSAADAKIAGGGAVAKADESPLMGRTGASVGLPGAVASP